MEKSKISVGLDIGTTKIVVMAGKRNEFNKVEILGIGKSKSLGVHRGVVNNITQTIQSIQQAVEEAKKIKLSAEADIEQSANKAKDGLRDEVAALVIAGAQKILDKEINAKANKDIIDSLIKKI